MGWILLVSRLEPGLVSCRCEGRRQRRHVTVGLVPGTLSVPWVHNPQPPLQCFICYSVPSKGCHRNPHTGLVPDSVGVGHRRQQMHSTRTRLTNWELAKKPSKLCLDGQRHWRHLWSTCRGALVLVKQFFLVSVDLRPHTVQACAERALKGSLAGVPN